MHNQSINVVETAKGNKFYDVCTGSAIGCPAYMRLVTVQDEKTVKIESVPVPDFNWDKKGQTSEQYLQAQFDRMIRSLIDCMQHDPVRLMNKLRIKQSPMLMKVFPILGKRVSRLTVGGFARLLAIRVDPALRKTSFLDFAVDMVRSVFEGNQPYVEGTPGGDALLKLFKRLRPFVKTLKGSQGETLDFYETMKHTVGNYGIDDYNAVLELS